MAAYPCWHRTCLFFSKWTSQSLRGVNSCIAACACVSECPCCCPSAFLRLAVSVSVASSLGRKPECLLASTLISLLVCEKLAVEPSQSPYQCVRTECILTSLVCAKLAVEPSQSPYQCVRTECILTSLVCAERIILISLTSVWGQNASLSPHRCVQTESVPSPHWCVQTECFPSPHRCV